MQNIVVKIQFYLYHYGLTDGKIQKRSDKGLNTIVDLIGEDGNIMSMEDIQIVI